MLHYSYLDRGLDRFGVLSRSLKPENGNYGIHQITLINTKTKLQIKPLLFLFFQRTRDPRGDLVEPAV